MSQVCSCRGRSVDEQVPSGRAVPHYTDYDDDYDNDNDNDSDRG